MNYSNFCVSVTKWVIATTVALASAGCSSISLTRPESSSDFAYNVRKLEAPQPPEIAIIPVEQAKTSEKQQAENIWDRIRSSMSLNQIDSPATQKYLSYYSSHPEMIDHVFLKAAPYLDYILTQVEKRKMPTEIALLPFIESGFDPTAVSRTGATGLWQFTAKTGKYYRLRQNSSYDGRKDVVASTNAALNYLQDLHLEMGENWLLALASYNGGPTYVKHAANRLTKPIESVRFEDLTRLRLETLNYVPKLLALSRIIQSPDKYNIQLPEMASDKVLEVREFEFPINLHHISERTGVGIETLRSLNPGIKKTFVSGRGKLAIALPANAAPPLDNSIQFAKTEIPETTNTKPTTTKIASTFTANPDTSAGYRIKRGDTLSRLAIKFGTTVNRLKVANSLKSDLIIAGHDLLIPGKSGRMGIQVAKNISKPGMEKNSGNIPGAYSNYKTETGDTLYKLSRRFGTDIASIKRANNLRDDILIAGALIKIPEVNKKRKGNLYALASQNLDTFKRRISYKVGPGDTLYAIANHYGIESEDILKVNNLQRSQEVREGQILAIFPSEKHLSRRTQVAARDVSSTNVIQKMRDRPMLNSSHGKVISKAPNENFNPYKPVVRYLVGPGDTLWAIARHYRVKVKQISTWNELKGASHIHVGQTLNIHPSI